MANKRKKLKLSREKARNFILLQIFISLGILVLREFWLYKYPLEIFLQFLHLIFPVFRFFWTHYFLLSYGIHKQTKSYATVNDYIADCTARFHL